MEHEIGEIIKLIHNKKTIKLKVEETPISTCKHCFFFYGTYICKTTSCLRSDYNLSTSFCSSIFRNDRKNIIYRKIK